MKVVLPLSDTVKTKAIRALERRFGKSIMPYRFTAVEASSPTRWRITDVESGSNLTFYNQTGRLHVLSEHDGAA